MTDDGGQQGIQVKLRALVSSEPEQRFTAHGAELIQFRASVVDGQVRHPPLVVRFGGQRRNDLWRWVKPGRHLTIEGSLEVKAWKQNDQPRVVLLIQAQSIFQLTDVADLSKVGVYANTGSSVGVVSAPNTSKAQRAEKVRALLEKSDGT